MLIIGHFIYIVKNAFWYNLYSYLIIQVKN